MSSIFNGFEGLISGLFNAYNPDLKVEPKSGMYLDVDAIKLEDVAELVTLDDLSAVTEAILGGPAKNELTAEASD